MKCFMARASPFRLEIQNSCGPGDLRPDAIHQNGCPCSAFVRYRGTRLAFEAYAAIEAIAIPLPQYRHRLLRWVTGIPIDHSQPVDSQHRTQSDASTRTIRPFAMTISSMRSPKVPSPKNHEAIFSKPCIVVQAHAIQFANLRVARQALKKLIDSGVNFRLECADLLSTLRSPIERLWVEFLTRKGEFDPINVEVPHTVQIPSSVPIESEILSLLDLSSKWPPHGRTLPSPDLVGSE